MFTYYHKLTGWAIAFLAMMVQPVVAQQRYDGTWNKISIATSSGSPIEDFDFVDSLNGISMDEFSHFIYSSDGGQSWHNATSGFRGELIKSYLGMVACTGPHIGNAMSEGGTVILTSDTSSISVPRPLYHEYDGYGPYIESAQTITEKMYDSAYGFRFAQDENPISYAFMDSARLLMTHDGWISDTEYGTRISGDFAYGSGSTNSSILSASLVDSNDVWIGLGNIILHTTNAGGTWDTLLPAGLNYLPDWFNIVANPNTDEVFAEAAFGPIDFAYSNDYGKTWRLDSTFNGFMVRLSLQAPGKLWGILCHHLVSNPPYQLYESGIFPNFYQNMIVYSSDTGKSWFIDSTTFADDTLLEMHWLDSRHGWVAGYGLGNSTNFIAYYNADGNASVSVVGFRAGQYQIYPDPATNIISTNPPFENISVFDPLGRQYFVKSSGGALDISSLPPGIYFIADGGIIRGRFVKE